MATEALFGVVSETRRMLGVLRSDTKQSALLPNGVEEATEWLRDALEKCRDDAFDPAAWLKVLFASDTSISGSLRKTHPEVEQTVVASVKRLVYCARCKQDRGAADTLCLVLELYLRDRAARSVEPVIRSMSKEDFDDTVQETIIRAWKNLEQWKGGRQNFSSELSQCGLFSCLSIYMHRYYSHESIHNASNTAPTNRSN